VTEKVKESEDFTPEEIERRRDEVVRRMLAAKPMKQIKPPTGKKRGRPPATQSA
jgi:hypothetical protein